MEHVQEDILKIILAIIVGGLIGSEREFRDKPAGFRTLICICAGAALFMILSMRIGGSDPVRIAANIVTGVGFLGAGALIREKGEVLGLTTASTIWLVAALGMGIGGEQYALVGVVTVALLIVLWGFPPIEHRIGSSREYRTYRLVMSADTDRFADYEQSLVRHGLRLRSHKHMKRDGDILCQWEATGSQKAHDAVTEAIIADPDVREFTF